MRLKHCTRMIVTLCALGGIGSSRPAGAVDVAVYEFGGNSNGSTDTDATTTANNWTQTVGVIANNRVQADGTEVDNTLASSLVNMEYGGFIWNSNGNSLDLAQLTLDYGAENAFGFQLHVFASTDGGATGFELGDQLFTIANLQNVNEIDPPAVTQIVTNTLDLAGIAALQGFNGAVEFRLYLQDGSSAGARVHLLDNVRLTALPSTQSDPRWNVNADGVWNVGGNWDTLSVPGAGASVVLGDVITANRTVTLDSDVSLNRLTFSGEAGSYTIAPAANQSITLAGDGEIRGLGGRTHTIDARISGSAGLTKTGGGVVVVSNAANNYTGGTDVQSGMLRVTSAGALQGAVVVGANATLAFSGDGAGNGYSGTFANALTGTGTALLSSTLTMETVAINSAKSFSGDIVINGGTLSLANGSGLGTGGSQASETFIDGDASTGKLAIAGNIAVANEWLAPEGRSTDAVHLTSAGNNAWNGAIASRGSAGQINIESASGTLTLGGLISAADDANQRTYVFSGAGNIAVTGVITDDGVDADGVTRTPSTANNVNVVKRGSGTLTISTELNDVDDYHRGSTLIEEGKLVVTAAGGTVGELSSQSVIVQAGATLDLTDFTTYNMQAESTLGYVQEYGGGGTISANNFGYFDDGSLSPGDGAGTLTFNGNLTMSTFTAAPLGALNFELSDATTVGNDVNDLIDVNGTLTANTSGGGTFSVNVTPVNGGLASGVYRLIEYNGSLAGNASGNAFVVNLIDGAGNPIGNTRQTFAVSTATSGQVNLQVSGVAKSLVWSGNVNDQWDTVLTSNWNSGTDQFFNLDSVVFNDTASQKTVNIAAGVLPASVDVNTTGTYTFTGAGIVGSPDIDVSSGTLLLNNSGNTFTGVVTVASGAVLQVGDGSTAANRLPDGDTPYVINGTLAINESADGETVSGPISGSGLLRVDSSVLILGGDNSGFTGAIEAGPGTAIRIFNTDTVSPLGTTAVGTTVGLGASLRAFGESGVVAEPVTLNGGQLRGGGGSASNVTWSGDITIGVGDPDNTAEIRLDGGTDTSTTNGMTITGNVIGSSGQDVRFSVDGGSTLVVSGNVQHGGGGLLKNGAGVLRLQGSNTHTGFTVISSGTLALVGGSDLSSSPLVQVQGLGTLDASGRTGGSYSVPAGQTLDVGGTVVGQTTATSGSTLAVGGDGLLEITPQTVTVTPPLGALGSNSDVRTRSGQANQNDEADLALGAVNASSVFRSLLTYDLSAAGIADPEFIDGVSLTMVLNGPSGAQVDVPSGPTLELHQLASGYNSDTVTFDTQPAFNDLIASVAGPNFASGYAGGATIAWSEQTSGTLIDAVKGALGSQLHLGAKVDDASEAAGTRSFYFLQSAEDGANAPSLEITFTDPNNPLVFGIGAGLIEGDLTTDAGSTLDFDVFDDSLFDTLAVTGSATLNGTLAVDLLDVSRVSQNDTFTILTAAAISNNLALGGPDGNLFNLSASTSTELVLTFVGGSALPGDFDHDGRVDGSDFLAWQRNPGIGSLADWQANFGASSQAAAAANVPEPATCCTMLAAAAVLIATRAAHKPRSHGNQNAN